MKRISGPVLLAWSLLLAASLACSLALPSSVLPPVDLPPSAPGQATAATTAPPAASPPVLPTLTPFVSAPAAVSDSEEQQLIELYAHANQSVVSIIVEIGQTGASQGSGFLFDDQGHVVTNHHVVEGGGRLQVDFPSGLKLRGQVLGVDPDSDLAVIRLDQLPEGVLPLALGDSDLVQVGQRVVAIGNPFGLAGTMTVGIISGLGRSLPGNRAAAGGGSFSAPNIIQTDAAINQGNSGGPLLNMRGEVIGVNRAIISESGVNSGVGFAIASNTVRQVVPYLISEGRFVYPYLGIGTRSEISLALQELLQLPQAAGAYVTNVTSGSPADQAGVRGDSAGPVATLRGDGDLIIAIDGREVKVFNDLMSYLVDHTRPGQVVTLTVLRGGEPLDIAVTLGERP
jgi:S1-C subfamily serine protease